MNKYTLNEQITVITNATRDLLLEKNPDSLILYMFYIKGTNYQGTNSVWHTDKFVRGGLKLPNGKNWGEKRLGDAKKVLLDNNLIEIDKRRNKDGSFDKTYIKVKYIFKHETKERLIERDFNQNPQNADVVENSAGLNRTNALSNYNLNALSNLKGNATPDKSGNSVESFPLAMKYVARFNELYSCRQTLTPTRMKSYKARVKTFGEESILIALENMAAQPFYRGENSRNWVPDIAWLIKSDDNVNKFLSPAKPIKKSLEERLKEEIPDAQIF